MTVAAAKTRPLTLSQANRVFDVLVHSARAEKAGRTCFLFHVKRGRAEHRVWSALDVWLRLHLEPGDWWVDAHPSHIEQRPGLLAVIAETNRALAELRAGLTSASPKGGDRG